MSVDESFSRKAKDVAAGFIGGATQVLIGQPADLVKIRLQTSTTTSSADIIKQVLTKEGPLAFYKGTLAPLFGVGACVSLQFYGFHETKRQLLKNSGESQLLLWPQTYIAGAMAGVVNTPVTAPVEQLRILSQSSTKSTSLKDTVKKIYGAHGFAGLYRGTTITLIREVQAYGVWFLTYESLIQGLINQRGYKLRGDISTIELLGCGALAGNALWLSSYPLDVIKSNIQSDKFGADSKYDGKISSATRAIWAANGMRGFWKGIVPCLLRAVPCSAGTFAAVETALRIMG
ncbi:mitochondrial carrier [Metschnikowia bicuspidata var. bicuspidata NRRL YB-4993]|uniref:Mitochondrial carrier n=1 Tax=Metschnikowia bicuspidata var. bicuspidata NRRL YB-4993 TaxID=869754 RepID=A0A1A0HHH7_9ASCO|nr:mitochondrial carrier [Metschnikowia bicuspidata var. bicuspidata NRRL YB-4993]OBA23332.1 mitochondrial carrier [Metschnikowia bicuspidata var. bicuspidata NRRL YB-4993]